MGRASRSFALLAALIASLTYFGVSPSVAQNKVILVLDSSGSMAGQIDNAVKLDIARSAIGDLLGKLEPTTQLGLVAYGHRRKGDCGDIQTIYQVGAPDRNAIMQAVSKLRAVGKTPLSAAVRQAAEQLNFTEDKATVILISDGIETCNADPCELGRELSAKGLDFKVHVVGFDIGADESAGLQCLAEATGGLYVPAGNAEALANAIHQAVKVAETVKPEPVPQPEPVAETGLRIDVVVSDGGPAWEGAIGVKILGEEANLDGKHQEIADAWRVNSGHIFKNLPTQTYVLEVTLPDHNHITRSFNIDVQADRAQTVTVNLDIGQIRFNASLSDDGPAFEGDLGWTVLAREKNLSGEQEQIAEFFRVKSGTVFWLPAGAWQVNGVLADARYMTTTKDLSVQAGGGQAHDFSFDTGTVRFDAGLTPEDDAMSEGIGWKIFSTSKDLSGNRELVTEFWRVQSGDIFLLPAGDWLVTGVLADHSHVTTEKTIHVEQGSEVAHGFDFDAGRVRFDVTVDNQPTPDDLGLNVFSAEQDLAGNRSSIAEFWRVRSGHIAILPAGAHYLTGLLADKRDVTGETTFEVNAGDEKNITIDLTLQ